MVEGQHRAVRRRGAKCDEGKNVGNVRVRKGSPKHEISFIVYLTMSFSFSELR